MNVSPTTEKLKSNIEFSNKFFFGALIACLFRGFFSALVFLLLLTQCENFSKLKHLICSCVVVLFNALIVWTTSNISCNDRCYERNKSSIERTKKILKMYKCEQGTTKRNRMKSRKFRRKLDGNFLIRPIYKQVNMCLKNCTCAFFYIFVLRSFVCLFFCYLFHSYRNRLFKH